MSMATQTALGCAAVLGVGGLEAEFPAQRTLPGFRVAGKGGGVFRIRLRAKAAL